MLHIKYALVASLGLPPERGIIIKVKIATATFPPIEFPSNLNMTLEKKAEGGGGEEKTQLGPLLLLVQDAIPF